MGYSKEDIKKFPKELQKQLKTARTERYGLEGKIVQAIYALGGEASVDDLLCYMCDNHDTIYSRKTMLTELYTLCRDKHIKRISSGVYTTGEWCPTCGGALDKNEIDNTRSEIAKSTPNK